MSEIHIYTKGWWELFFCETFLPFCFVLLGSKFFPSLYNFPNTQAPLHGHTSHLCSAYGHTFCLASHPWRHFHWRTPAFCLPLEISGHPVMLSTQHAQHFHRSIILFTKENRHPSCHATHATYVACQKNLPVAIYHM